MYLIKANRRCLSNHQYIIGVSDDEDIAHFVGKYHCKFIRADKYYYSIESFPHLSKRCFITSWENEDETLRYMVHRDKDIAKLPKYAYKKWRFKAQFYESIEDLPDEEIKDAADYWHFFDGKELLGLRKVYEKFRLRRVEEWKKKNESNK